MGKGGWEDSRLAEARGMDATSVLLCAYNRCNGILGELEHVFGGGFGEISDHEDGEVMIMEVAVRICILADLQKIDILSAL